MNTNTSTKKIGNKEIQHVPEIKITDTNARAPIPGWTGGSKPADVDTFTAILKPMTRKAGERHTDEQISGNTGTEATEEGVVESARDSRKQTIVGYLGKSAPEGLDTFTAVMRAKTGTGER